MVPVLRLHHLHQGKNVVNKKTDNDNNNNNNNVSIAIDLSVGAHELMVNGFSHLIEDYEYDMKIFIPLQYQTLIETSACSGFDLAIGICHIFGFGNFIKDAEKGYNIITKYYENNKNDSLSQNILGFLHYIEIEPLKGFDTEDNIKKAFDYFCKSAEQGDAYGECWLGKCYYFYGYGVKQDKKKAFDLFMKSTKQGSAIGQYYLGVAYEYGNGVAKDDKKAFEWYKKSAVQGYAKGIEALADNYRYGTGVDIDMNKAFEWYKKASELGHARSSKTIGDMYASGEDGFSKDGKKALDWYTKAAEQNLYYLFDIASNYYYGYYGLPKNYKFAFECYTKSAQQYKEPKSMPRIAEMYANGHYVEKDYGKAEEWYKKAADHGKRSRFDYDLAEFFYKHLQNYDKAFEYYTEAIEKEDDVDVTRWSECKLGILYKNGEGVRKNYKKAFECFTKAVQDEDGGLC